MNLSEQQLAFLEQNHSAAMITLRPNGTPHVARVGVALVDGKLWSSGTQTRLRTRHVRRDPRATLFVFDPAARYLGIESAVTILDGPDAPEQSVRLFQVMQANMATRPAAGSLMWFGQERTRGGFSESWRTSSV
jgi:PPOX class probable F420-dependent enzyme